MARKPTPPRERPSFDTVPQGPGRFTVTRFLSDCCDETYWFLVDNWVAGNQLEARKVPWDALPAVVILAAYARDYEVEIVDDYIALLQRYDDHVAEVRHPDKFMASSISIMAESGTAPSDEAYETINIPAIYEELFP